MERRELTSVLGEVVESVEALDPDRLDDDELLDVAGLLDVIGNSLTALRWQIVWANGLLDHPDLRTTVVSRTGEGV